jgi:hypothetical protein
MGREKFIGLGGTECAKANGLDAWVSETMNVSTRRS